MLRNFTAALIATALIAGPALAAQPSNDAGAVPAAAAAPAPPAHPQTQTPAKQTEVRKPVKTVKHARIQVRHAWTYGRHHVAHVAKHLAKPGKVSKSIKTMKSSA